MTKKPVKINVSEKKDDPQIIVPARDLKNAFRLNDEDLLDRKLVEIQNLLFFSPEVDEKVQRTQIVRALELYESLEPADGAEGMLAMQMVGTHDAALECLRRATIPSQTFEGRNMALKHAHKLMSLYTQQLAALNKHRGKGQQKVTVEHVNVEPGGQAIVGNVETNSKRSPSEDLKAIEQRHYAEGEEILDMVRSAKAKIDARKK